MIEPRSSLDVPWRLILASTGAALLAGWLAVALAVPIEFLLIGVTATILGCSLVWRAFHGGVDPFDPLLFFAVAYGVMFVVRPTAMLVTDALVNVRPTRTLDLTSTFTEMLAIAALGAAGFVVGYLVPTGRGLADRLRPAPETLNAGRIWTATLILSAIGVGLFGVFVGELGGIPGVAVLLAGRSPELQRALLDASAYFVYGVTLLVPAAMLLIGVGIRQRRPRMTAVGIGVAFLVLFIGGPIGSRILLLPLLAGGVVLVYVAREKRPSILTLVAVTLAGLTASAFILTVRESSVRRESGVIEAAVQLAADPGRIITPLIEGEDAAMASYLAAALRFIPEEIPHTLGGATFGDLVTRPIPRQLWAEKPIAPREQVIKTIWPVEYAYGVANPEFSVLLGFYLDLGAAGVVAGMVGYGILWRALYEYFARYRSRLSAQLVFAITLPLLAVAARDSAVDTLIRVVLVTLPVVVIIYLSGDAGRTPTSQPGRQGRASPNVVPERTGS